MLAARAGGRSRQGGAEKAYGAGGEGRELTRRLTTLGGHAGAVGKRAKSGGRRRRRLCPTTTSGGTLEVTSGAEGKDGWFVSEGEKGFSKLGRLHVRLVNLSDRPEPQSRSWWGLRERCIVVGNALEDAAQLLATGASACAIVYYYDTQEHKIHRSGTRWGAPPRQRRWGSRQRMRGR